MSDDAMSHKSQSHSVFL